MTGIKDQGYRNSGIRSIVGLGLMFWVFLAVHPCLAQEPVTEKLAVMPFIKGHDPQNLGQTLSCPFARFCYEEMGLAEGADETMTRLLQALLKEKQTAPVIPEEDVRRVYEALLFDRASDTPLHVATILGRRLNASHVMVGNVWRYREREGTSFSVQTPASIAFSLYLVDVRSGTPVWEASYDETQKSLSENLLDAPEFFRRGAKWLTVEELARSGLGKALEDYPKYPE